MAKKKQLIEVEAEYIADLQQAFAEDPVTDGQIHFVPTWLKLYEGTNGGELGIAAEFWPEVSDVYYWVLGEITVKFKGLLRPRRYLGAWHADASTFEYPSGIFNQRSTKNAPDGRQGPTMAESQFFKGIVDRVFAAIERHPEVMEQAQKILEGPAANPGAFQSLSDKNLIEVIGSYADVLKKLGEQSQTAKVQANIAETQNMLKLAAAEAQSRGGRVARQAKRALKGPAANPSSVKTGMRQFLRKNPDCKQFWSAASIFSNDYNELEARVILFSNSLKGAKRHAKTLQSQWTAPVLIFRHDAKDDFAPLRVLEYEDDDGYRVGPSKIDAPLEEMDFDEDEVPSLRYTGYASNPGVFENPTYKLEKLRKGDVVVLRVPLFGREELTVREVHSDGIQDVEDGRFYLASELIDDGEGNIYVKKAARRNPKKGAAKRKSKRKASKAKPRKKASKNPRRSCPHCKARSGRPCVTPSGNPTKVHAARRK
jgi:hypothetical protein